MSCESCTGCFSADVCDAPSPSAKGHISKEYRHFLKAAQVCQRVLDEHDRKNKTTTSTGQSLEVPSTQSLTPPSPLPSVPSSPSLSLARKEKQDHVFNTLINVLANHQFTAQSLLAQAYQQQFPTAAEFLMFCRLLAHHGFWGRMITWAFLVVKDQDSLELQKLLEAKDIALQQRVNDEAEVLEMFNPGVNCQRIQWNEEMMIMEL